MGYNIRPGLVEENVDVLEQIRAAVENKEIIRYEPPRQDLYTWQWRLRRVLKATEVLRTEMGGRFAGLGELVKLKVDAKAGLLIVQPKGAKPGMQLKQKRINMNDALETLKSYNGELTTLEFYPHDGYDEEELVRRAEAMGWRVYPEAKQEVDEEDAIKFIYPAERIKDKRSAFDILDG